MTTVPTLSDGTVTLRALRRSDIPGCYEQCTDPLSVRWTTVPVPFSPADAHEFCLEIAPGAWADGSQWIFAVETEGRYAGNIALRPEQPGRAELAYGSHPAARGTGTMERACRLLLDWGFAEKGLHTVVWQANIGNWASRKLAWRLGFRIEGTLRSYLSHRGELVDAWIGTLLAGDPRSPQSRWLTSPVLEGDGVRLRPFGEGDVPRIVEACSDERTTHWLGQMPVPYADSDARGWFERSREQQATGTGTTWAVADPVTDVARGSIAVFAIEENVDCEIGYWTHPDVRGRGIMTAAMRRVVDWCFEELELPRVRAVAAVDNAASRHVIESAGLTLTGTERLATTLRTGLADVALYDVLATEWSERSASRSVRR